MTYAILLFFLLGADTPTPAAMEQTIKELVIQNAALQAEVVRLEASLFDCEADVDRSVAREKDAWAMLDQKSQTYNEEIKRLNWVNRWKSAEKWLYAAGGAAVVYVIED